MKSAPLEVCWTGSVGGGRVSRAISGNGGELGAVVDAGIGSAAAVGAPRTAPAAVAPFRKRRRPMAFSDFDMCAPFVPRARHDNARPPQTFRQMPAWLATWLPKRALETHVALRYCAPFSKRLNGFGYAGEWVGDVAFACPVGCLNRRGVGRFGCRAAARRSNECRELAWLGQ